jgi:hypothetical protein
VNSLLSQAQGLDQEASDIESTIGSLKEEQAGYEAQAAAASQSASSSSSASSTSSTSSSPTVTGTASGSTSSTSAADTAAQQASQYEADAAAVGRQITALQGQVNSLHQQAGQLRQQASQVKSARTDSRRTVAVTTTSTQEATFSFPILKTETTAEGDLVVYGKATDGTVDSDDQIVDPGWSGKALTNWLASGANLRVQHNPHRDPAGVGLQVDVDRDGDGSHYLKALVCEPTAKKLVSKGALRAFSVGIMRPRVVTDTKARGGRIVDGEFGEVSLVDRPANRNCSFTLVKADKKGDAAWVGALTGDPDFLAKSLTPKPSDMARMLGKRAVEPGPRQPQVQQGTIPAAVFADPVAQRLNEALRLEKEIQASGRVVDSSGKDRSSVDDKDFAGPGKTFPIASQDDVSDAASLAHHADNPGAVRSRIRSIAQRKWPGMQLPPSLSDDKGTEADVEKAGMKACPGCGKNYHADSKMKNCENCGHKLPVVKADGEKECPTCHGDGMILDNHRKCPDCGGSGMVDAGFTGKGHDQDMGDRMQENDENSGADSNGSDDNSDDEDDDNGGGGQDTADNDDVGEEDNIKVRKGGMFCPACGSKLKKKGMFCPGCGSKLAMPGTGKHVIPHSHPSPGDGVKAKDTDPAARHREPDGPQTEDFEADSGMQDGDSPGKKPAEPAPTWGKSRGSTDPSTGVAHTPGTASGPDPDSEEERDNESYMAGHGESDDRPASPDGLSQVKMRTADVPYTVMRMHDALCAAYDGADVLAEYPSLKVLADAVDAGQWRAAAQDVVAAGNMDAGLRALAVASAAEALKTMDPGAVSDGRAMLRKDFASMYPDVHLAPGQITAQQFQRPYIAEGHAPLSAQSPGSEPPGKIPPGSPSASQFTRGPLTDGHESPSPGNGGNRVPSFSGPPMGHMSAPKGMAASAIAVIHDHIALEWPGLCAMGNSHVTGPQHKTGIDATGGAGSQIADQIRRHQQQGSAQAGPQQITKAQAPLVPVFRKSTKAAMSGLTEQSLKTVLAAELSKTTSALAETFTEKISGYREQNELLQKQVGDLQKQIDAIGSQPDPYLAPPRSATAYAPDADSGGAVPAERRSLVDEAADKVRADKLRFLKSLAVSGDPVIREGAQDQIRKLLMAP